MNSLPARSHLTDPLASLTTPLISKESFARQPRGLNERTQVSPVRWFLTSMSPLEKKDEEHKAVSALLFSELQETGRRTNGR